MESEIDTGVEPVPPPPLPPAPQPRPWGFWATIGLSLVLIVAVMFAEIVVFLIGVLCTRPASVDAVKEAVFALENNGILLSLSTLAATPICLTLSFVFVKLRRGMTIRDYFGLRWIGWRRLAMWCVVLGVYLLVFAILGFVIDRPFIEDFRLNVYSTVYSTTFAKALLWFALILVAPLQEEVLFRGFVFKGFRHSWVGAVGAIVLPSLVWAALHVQYDLFDISAIFVGGLLMGYARLRTDSIYPPLMMHALMNLIATIEVDLYMRFTTPGA